MNMTRSNVGVYLVVVVLAACASRGPSTKTVVAPSSIVSDVRDATDDAAAQTTRVDPLTIPPPSLRLPGDVIPVEYHVELTIDPKQERFSGVIAIDVDVVRPTDVLWLNANLIDIKRATITVDGQERVLGTRFTADKSDFVGFFDDRRFDVGKARIRIEYHGLFGKLATGGLFRLREGGQWYVFSHFEPLDARRAFPCFDEPNFKVPWNFVLNVKQSDRAFANTPMIASRPKLGTDWVAYQFARSPALPSYLISFAVGPLEVVDIGTIGRNRVPARIIVPRGRTADAQYASKTIPEALNWMENYFDMPYPYAKLDNVAIPRQGGAMEHPGLITYGASILLTENGKLRDTSEDFHMMVVAHELAHQWFGNLVTLEWWNDLWLNESFATWMASKLRRDTKPQWNSDVRELVRLDWTKQVDSRKNARSLRRPIQNNQDIEGAFDSISYGKGGAVLTMFERWVGEDAFRRGVRAYIRKHAGKTATSEDFLASLSEAANPAIAMAFATFLTQPGIPLISAEMQCQGGTEPKSPTLILRQQAFTSDHAISAPRRWSTPVCVRYGRGARTHKQCMLMTDKVATMVLDKARSCPDWLVGNADAGGYYRVSYAKSMRDALLAGGLDRLNTMEQIVTLDDMRMFAEAGTLEVGEILRLISRLSKHKKSRVVSSVASMMSSVRTAFVNDSLRPTYERFVRKKFGKHARRLGWLNREHDSAAVRALRDSVVPVVAMAGNDKRLQEQARKLSLSWLNDPKSLPRSSWSPVLSAALMDADDPFYDRFATAFVGIKDPRRRFPLLLALAQTSRLDRLQTHWRRTLDGTYHWRDAWLFLRLPLIERKTQAAAFEFLVDNFDVIVKKVPRKWQAQVLSAFNVLCDDRYRLDVQRLFSDKAATMTRGPEILDQTLRDIERCVALRSVQQPAIETFLRSWNGR